MRAENPFIASMTTFIAAIMLPGAAFAYVGPGAGVSVLGALWGLIIGIVVAVGAILFWPIRMLIRKKRQKNATAEDTPAEQATSNDRKPSEPVSD